MQVLVCTVHSVVAETRQIHTNYESCGGKGMAWPLSQGESAPTLALTGFYCFSGHITLRMVFIYYAQVHLGGYILLTTKERMLLLTSKKKDIGKCKGKSG